MMKTGYFRFSQLFTDKSYRSMLIVLFIFPLTVFLQTLGFEFLWDDIDIHLIGNPFLNPPDAGNIAHFWKEVYVGLYIPVAYTMWALIKILSSAATLQPGDAVLYHLLNILLHLINGMLVFTLLHRLIQNKWAVLAGSLMFLIHPLQAESVAWVSEMRGLLAACLGFTSMLLYLKSSYQRESGEKSNKAALYSVSALIIFIAALLSKPSAVVFPLFIALYEYMLFRRNLKQLLTGLWYWILPVMAVFIITSSAQQTVQHTSFLQRPFIFLDSTAFYLYKLLIPLNLSGCYGLTPAFMKNQWWLNIAWIVPVLLFSYTWIIRKRQPLLFISFLLFIAGFLPVSGLIDFTYQDWSTVADRYMYLPVFGAALAFSLFVDFCLKQKKYLKAVPLIVLLLWTVLTAFIQLPLWKNPVVFWSHVTDYVPGEARAWYNRGLSYVRIQNYDAAIADFSKAIDRGFSKALVNRGGAYIKTAGYGKALDDLNKAIQIDPANELAYYNRGGAYLLLKKYDSAVADFNHALKLNPANQNALLNRNKAERLLHPEADSGSMIQNVASDTRSGNDLSFYNLANQMAEKGKYELAIHYYSQAIGQNPKLEEAYINRGNCFAAIKEYKKAISDYSIVLGINPSSAIMLNNIATSYFNLGNKDKACEYWKKGMMLNNRESAEAFKKHCR
jgi:tetratricopeptide (TPR) repeat protein